MKRIALLMILFLFGCIAQNPEGIVKNAIKKSQTINNYRMDYKVNMSLGEETVIMEVSTFRKGHNMRMDGKMEDFEFRTYSKDNKTTMCVYLNESWRCERIATSYDFEKFGVLQFMERMNESIEKKALNLSKDIITTKIAGRGCQLVSGVMDVGKIGGSGISNFVECLDNETGFPLLFAMETEINGKKMRMKMQVDLLEIKELKDSFFELPS